MSMAVAITPPCRDPCGFFSISVTGEGDPARLLCVRPALLGEIGEGEPDEAREERTSRNLRVPIEARSRCARAASASTRPGREASRPPSRPQRRGGLGASEEGAAALDESRLRKPGVGRGRRKPRESARRSRGRASGRRMNLTEATVIGAVGGDHAPPCPSRVATSPSGTTRLTRPIVRASLRVEAGAGG